MYWRSKESLTNVGHYIRTKIWTKGAFLVKDDRVLKGPLGRSLRLFPRTAHSGHLLHRPPLCYACFARSLRLQARSLTSPTPLRGS